MNGKFAEWWFKSNSKFDKDDAMHRLAEEAFTAGLECSSKLENLNKQPLGLFPFPRD